MLQILLTLLESIPLNRNQEIKMEAIQIAAMLNNNNYRSSHHTNLLTLHQSKKINLSKISHKKIVL